MFSRRIEMDLVSNQFVLSKSPDRVGWLIPSDPARPKAELWEQFRSQGYLWLKGILERNSVLDFRRRFFQALTSTGLTDPLGDLVEGVYSGGEDKTVARQQMSEFVRCAVYESFCLAAPIWKFYEEFLGGQVMLHRRKILRYIRPGDRACTGAHYDLTYLRAGTDRVYTGWIPIGDTAVEMGGLVYLEGSDALGRQIEADFSRENATMQPAERINAYNRNMADTGWITKDLPSLADRLKARWLLADYEAGDMVVHSAYMIHAATENRDPSRRIRLSTDIRYQLVADQVDTRWNNDWSPSDGL